MAPKADFSRLQLWGLSGFAATAYFAKGINWLFFLLILIGSLSLVRSKIAQLRDNPMFWPVVGLIGLSLLSALWSDPTELVFWTHVILYALIALTPILAVTVRSADAKIIMGIFALASLLAAVLVLLNLGLDIPKWAIWKSLLSYDGNKAIANGVLLSCAAGLWLHWGLAQWADYGWRSRMGLACVISALVIAAAVALTAQSRTALLLLPMAILIAFALSGLPLKQRLLLGLAAVLAVAGLLASSDQAVTRLKTAVQGLSITAPQQAASNSVSIRQSMNKHSLQLIEERPWTGYGLGGWAREWNARAAQHKLHSSVTAHNEYLNVTAQLGVIGGLLFLAVMATLLASSFETDRRERAVAVLLACAWVWTSAFNSTLRDTVFSLPLIVIAGLALAASRRSNHLAVEMPSQALSPAQSSPGDLPAN